MPSRRRGPAVGLSRIALSTALNDADHCRASMQFSELPDRDPRQPSLLRYGQGRVATG
jgi:hypothetical protein